MRKFDPSKPVQTRNGWPARIICTDFCGPAGRNIVALVRCADDYEQLLSFNSDGLFYPPIGTSPRDLVNVPEVKKEYRGVYSNGDFASIKYGSLDRLKALDTKFVGYAEIVCEDGEVVDINFIKKETSNDCQVCAVL